jgi:hypothetical protein
MTRTEAEAAIVAARDMLDYYRKFPRVATMMRENRVNPDCGWCGGKGCIWCNK